MNKNALLSIIVSLFVFLIFSGLALYKYANYNLYEAPEKLNFSQNKSVLNNYKKKDNWVLELAKIPKKDYILPVNEIYIDYSSAYKTNTKTAYELIVNKSDIYSMFCIKQTLYSEEVEFIIVKDGNLNKILLSTNDLGLLQNIITKLKTYGINSDVVEVKI